MNTLGLLILLGVILSVASFLFFEARAIKTSREYRKLHKDDTEDQKRFDIYKSFEEYDTANNTIRFFIASFVISLFIAIIGHSSEYGLLEALAYIFSSTFIGSIVIFAIKYKKSLLIKVFAAFLYGVPHIAAAAFAFLARFLIS